MDSSWASSRTEGNFAPYPRSPRATASFTAKAICSKRGSAELRSTRRNMAGVPTVLGELVQSREKKYAPVDVDVAVDVDVDAPVIVAVHMNGNATVSVIDPLDHAHGGGHVHVHGH